MTLRWGIASAGRISHDFVCALQTLPENDHKIQAIAARSLESAQKFATAHKIPTALEGYEALAKLSTVDIVYVGVINTLHLEVAKLMLQNGKHVLCEKPLTLNKKQSTELLEFAKSKQLFLMEAVWSRCFPAYKELRKQLDSGVIGDVIYTNVSFGFKLSHVDRVNVKELGGGTILDLGVYTLQFTQFVYRGLKPTKITSSGFLNQYGTDESANAIILYPGNKTGTLSTSARAELPNVGIIVGTKGMIKVPNFWCPTKIITPTETLTFDLPKSTATFNFSDSVGLSYEAEECRRCINAGLMESPHMTHKESLELSDLMDKIRKDIGVVYPADL